MTKWIQKKVSINRSTSIDCETIEYIRAGMGDKSGYRMS